MKIPPGLSLLMGRAWGIFNLFDGRLNWIKRLFSKKLNNDKYTLST
ncbi:MAG: hypothetical protein SV062_12505 [Thermodesulfobacteriota bacterium]|nr:hypothetical protein [Thermodesulfobacteriota bacterium]